MEVIMSIYFKVITITFFIIILIASIFMLHNTYTNKTPLMAEPYNQADKIVVKKGERKLLLLKNGKIIRKYKIALGFNPNGDKKQEGDGKTPEGIYYISGRNPKSKFHLSLRISYPSEQDKKEAELKNVSPGGDIMIHGLPNKKSFLGTAHTLVDWTAGCIAVTNTEIEEIWSLVENGTEIEILP